VFQIRIATISHCLFYAEALSTALNIDNRFQASILMPEDLHLNTTLHTDLFDAVLVDIRSFKTEEPDWTATIARLFSRARLILLGAQASSAIPGVTAFVPDHSSLDLVKRNLESLCMGQLLMFPGPSLVPPARPYKPGRNGLADKLIRTKHLSVREIEVLQQLSYSCTNYEIACHLNLSQHTVKNHIYSIFKKLGIQKRSHAFVLANRLLGQSLPSARIKAEK